MSDRNMSAQRLETGFGEDLRDQTHVLVHNDVAAVAHRDSGGLLTAMLQRVQTKVGQLGDFIPRCPDPEYSAGVLRALFIRQKVVAESAIASDHVLSVLPALVTFEEPTTTGDEDANPITGADLTSARDTNGYIATAVEIDNEHAVVAVVRGRAHRS